MPTMLLQILSLQYLTFWKFVGVNPLSPSWSANGQFTMFHGQVVCALDFEAGDPGSIPGSGGTSNWLFSAGWYPDQVLLPAVSA